MLRLIKLRATTIKASEQPMSRILDVLAHRRQDQKTADVTELQPVRPPPSHGKMNYWQSNKFLLPFSHPTGKNRRQKAPKSEEQKEAFRAHERAKKRRARSQLDGEGQTKRSKVKLTPASDVQSHCKRRTSSPRGGPAKKTAAVQIHEDVPGQQTQSTASSSSTIFTVWPREMQDQTDAM